MLEPPPDAVSHAGLPVMRIRERRWFDPGRPGGNEGDVVMRSGWALLTVAIALLVNTPALAGLSKQVPKVIVREFNAEARAVRAVNDLLPVKYVEVEGRSYAWVLPSRFQRLAGEGRRFRITSTKYLPVAIRLVLRSEEGAEVSVWLTTTGSVDQPFLDAVFPAAVSALFDFGPAPAVSHFVGNVDSRMFHVGGCNHLPDPGQRTEFDTREAAAKAGFRACPVCFATEVPLPLPGYGPRRVAALEGARLKELANPPAPDPALQERIAQMGARLLKVFPLELQGYEYSFKVLHSEIPNAEALSTGFVYMTDKLVSAAEDSLELELVLAHEIAHVELQRALAELPAWGTVVDLAKAAGLRWEQSHWIETEKDMLALCCLRNLHAGVDVSGRARHVLDRLQFAAEAAPALEEAGETHPRYTDRLALFEPGRFVMSAETRSFCGVSEAGDTLVAVRVVGVFNSRPDENPPGLSSAFLGSGPLRASRVVDGRLRPGLQAMAVLYLLVEVSDLVNEPFRGGSGRLLDEAGQSLELESGDVLFPLAAGEAGIVPFRIKDGIASIHDVKLLKLEGIDGVKSWVVSGGL